MSGGTEDVFRVVAASRIDRRGARAQFTGDSPVNETGGPVSASNWRGSRQPSRHPRVQCASPNTQSLNLHLPSTPRPWDISHAVFVNILFVMQVTRGGAASHRGVRLRN